MSQTKSRPKDHAMGRIEPITARDELPEVLEQGSKTDGEAMGLLEPITSRDELPDELKAQGDGSGLVFDEVDEPLGSRGEVNDHQSRYANENRGSKKMRRFRSLFRSKWLSNWLKKRSSK